MNKKIAPQIIALIPARGGSKSVPRKNIKLLGGKPLIAYSIEAAKQCPEIARVIVSTEDPEIAAVARDYGAEVPFLRPKELSEDHTQDLPVIEQFLQWLKENGQDLPQILVWLRPTSPLRKPQHIREAIRLFLKSDGIDCVRSICPAPKHPLKMWRLENGDMVPFIPKTVYGIEEPYNYPRQKLPAAFIQNGAVEVIRTTTIFEKRSMTGDKIKGYLMSEEDSINIDTPTDFMFAEQLILKQKETSL